MRKFYLERFLGRAIQNICAQVKKIELVSRIWTAVRSEQRPHLMETGAVQRTLEYCSVWSRACTCLHQTVLDMDHHRERGVTPSWTASLSEGKVWGRVLSGPVSVVTTCSTWRILSQQCFWMLQHASTIWVISIFSILSFFKSVYKCMCGYMCTCVQMGVTKINTGL